MDGWLFVLVCLVDECMIFKAKKPPHKNPKKVKKTKTKTQNTKGTRTLSNKKKIKIKKRN